MELQTQLAVKGTVHVVIGASGGIGTSVARILAASEARVALVGRDAAKLEAICGEVDGRVFLLDANRDESWNDCLQQAHEWGGRLDGVVNCAGSILLKPAHLTTSDEFE